MKVRLRNVVVALIVVLLSVGAGLLARELWIRRQGELGRQALDLLPSVAQRIQDFHRVRIDDGRKMWEVSAREAQYFDEEEFVVVREPMVSVFLEDGRVIALRGNEGKVFLGGRDLERVELTGDIDVRLGEYLLQTEFVKYEVEGDLIVAPGRVQIAGDVFDILGGRMEVEVKSQRLTVSREVEMTLWPRT